MPMNKLDFIVLGYKPGLNKYGEVNLIISLIWHAIFKSYCICENRRKYVDIMFYVNSYLTKVIEEYKKNLLF